MIVPTNNVPVIDKSVCYSTYEEFYQANWHRVVNYLNKKCVSYADAEDIASQAFLYCYECWDRYDPQKASQVTWLFVVVRSRWLNYYRSNKKNINYDSLSNILAEDTNPVEAAAQLDEARHLIAVALEQLSNDQKKAVIYRFFTDLSDQDIAALLKTSSGNVRVMISRALRKMKVYMESMLEKENEGYSEQGNIQEIRLRKARGD